MIPALLPGVRDVGAKTFRHGTHRAMPPADTVHRIRPLMQAMGITRVANITGLDRIGIPVVMVCRPNSRSLAVSQGKGLDLAAAQASGLMESVESYHAERIALPLTLGSYADLRCSRRLLDPMRLPRREGGGYDAALPLLWIEGFDLLRQEHAWVPYELVHTNFTLPLPAGSGCFPASSNGLASGNHRLEAISHALCELVERDATTLWLLRDEDERRASRIDPATIDDAGCREILARYARADIDVAIWETTSDIGLPAFTCMIAERTPEPRRPQPAHAGMGCHPARHVALLRALTEAAQVRLTVIAGARDDVFRAEYERGGHPDTLGRLREHLRISGPLRDYHDVPTFEGETFEADVAWELERLRAAGIEHAVMIDLTRPEFELPVVRVVVPGLEGVSWVPGYVFGARAAEVLLERSERLEL